MTHMCILLCCQIALWNYVERVVDFFDWFCPTVLNRDACHHKYSLLSALDTGISWWMKVVAVPLSSVTTYFSKGYLSIIKIGLRLERRKYWVI
jgi:hypothetical protein